MGKGPDSKTSDERAERLSRALRENLRRRKAQTRLRVTSTEEPDRSVETDNNDSEQ